MRSAGVWRSALCAAAVLCVGPAKAGDSPATLTLETLLARLSAGSGVSASFRQEKHFALLSAPLESRGRMIFVPPDCLLFRIDRPAPSRLVVAGGQVAYIDESAVADGTAQTGGAEIDLSSDPTARAFVDNFVALFRGDRARLEQRYTLDFAASNDAGGPRWSLTLRPREPRVRSVIDSIELRGGDGPVREMVLLEAGGDSTRTLFEDVDTEPRFSSEELSALFGPRSSCEPS